MNLKEELDLLYVIGRPFKIFRLFGFTAKFVVSRFVNFEGILGFSFPSIISLGAALMQIIMFERARLALPAET